LASYCGHWTITVTNRSTQRVITLRSKIGQFIDTDVHYEGAHPSQVALMGRHCPQTLPHFLHTPQIC